MPLRRLSERNRERVLFWLLAVFIASSFYSQYQNRQRAMEGEQAHDALCAYVSDLTTRRDTAQGYLNDQKGDPIVIATILVNGEPLQVSRGQIRRDVNAQTQVIRAYDNLDCKEES